MHKYNKREAENSNAFFFLSFKENTILKQHKSWAGVRISNHIKKNIIFLGITRGVERQYRINNVNLFQNECREEREKEEQENK